MVAIAEIAGVSLTEPLPAMCKDYIPVSAGQLAISISNFYA